MIESVEGHEELRLPAQPTIIEEAEPNMSDLSTSLPPANKQMETQEDKPPSPSPGLKGKILISNFAAKEYKRI